MTFFFQTNPIGVILEIVLAPPSLSTGVSGCFLSTVQKTWNKVRASVIKRASHGSGEWIKASCSKSMRFCKENIHISNVINTFLSLPVSVVRGSHSGGWCRTSALRDWWRTRREKKTKRQSWIRSTKRGFVKKNVGGFRYRRLVFLC